MVNHVAWAEGSELGMGEKRRSNDGLWRIGTRWPVCAGVGLRKRHELLRCPQRGSYQGASFRQKRASENQKLARQHDPCTHTIYRLCSLIDNREMWFPTHDSWKMTSTMTTHTATDKSVPSQYTSSQPSRLLPRQPRLPLRRLPRNAHERPPSPSRPEQRSHKWCSQRTI